MSSLVCRSVCINIVFGRGTKAGWGPGTLSLTTTATATAMASFQRYSGKPERWRQEQRQGEPGKLFYIIPRHNRANLSVHTHTHTHMLKWSEGREGELHHPLCFFNIQIGNILGSSLHIDCTEKAPAGFRFTFAAFSAMSSNYNNELRRSEGTQTPREISIMSSMHGRDSKTAAPRRASLRGVGIELLSWLNLVVKHDVSDDVRLIFIPGWK